MKRLLLCFLLFSFSICNSQSKPLDSLLTALKTAKEDTSKVLLLNYISQQYILHDTKEAIKYAKISVDISEKLNYARGKSIGYINIGRCFEREFNYKEALKYYLLGLEINEKRNDKLSIARSYGDIATIYEVTGVFDQALYYYFKKLAILNKLDSKKTLRSFASTYNAIGVTYKDKFQFDSALKYLSEAEKINLKLKDSILLVDVLFNKGLVYDEMPEHDAEALQYYLKALHFSEIQHYEAALPPIFIGIADIYNKENKFDEAITFAQKGIYYSRLTGNNIWVDYGYKSLITAYAGKKDYRTKSDYTEKLMLFKDSFLTEENNTQLSKLRIKFETEEKEKENIILTNQIQMKELQLTNNRYLLSGVIGLLLVVVGFGFLLFRQNKLKSEQKALLLEQKLLRLQMNPHFIFNCLQAIQNFIEEKQATKYLSSFGALTRAVLENSRMETIPLSKEIELLEHYLELQKLLHEEQFTFIINIAPNLDTENINIPPMLAQPFIENAIEHGMRAIESDGTIEISFSANNNNLNFQIKDNGPGINVNKNKEHHSLATTITHERLTLVNKKNKRKTNFTVTEAFPDETRKGVMVNFTIPI